MTTALAIERQGPIGLITLNRPERHNAFDDVLIVELTEALRTMEADETVRMVVLAGAGPLSGAGAGLTWGPSPAGARKEENQREAKHMGAL